MTDHGKTSDGAARLRSRAWFDNRDNPGMTALHLERYQNSDYTSEELQSGRPIIGVAQTGSDLTPCNKIHVFLMDRIKAGIRDGGGIPMEFPVHPIHENGKRPTAALDRNLAYLGLVEVLHGYPLDGVVLTTGCDKTTPAMLMGAATVDLPAIVLSGGPMLDGWWKGELAGSGTIIWESRRLLAEGLIDYQEFIDRARDSYDFVIIDTPPVLVVPDARVIGQSVDAIIFSVKWNKTGKSQVVDALRQFSSVNLKVTGLVLSQIDAKGMKRYGYGGKYGAYSRYGKKYYGA